MKIQAMEENRAWKINLCGVLRHEQRPDSIQMTQLKETAPKAS